jgi:hypothetical protein
MPAHLQQWAIVWVPQSTVQNRESPWRSYRLADYVRKFGIADVTTLDEGLGRLGSRLTECPGFQRLLPEACCKGQVGECFVWKHQVWHATL